MVYRSPEVEAESYFMFSVFFIFIFLTLLYKFNIYFILIIWVGFAIFTKYYFRKNCLRIDNEMSKTKGTKKFIGEVFFWIYFSASIFSLIGIFYIAK